MPTPARARRERWRPQAGASGLGAGAQQGLESPRVLATVLFRCSPGGRERVGQRRGEERRVLAEQEVKPGELGRGEGMPDEITPPATGGQRGFSAARSFLK